MVDKLFKDSYSNWNKIRKLRDGLIGRSMGGDKAKDLGKRNFNPPRSKKYNMQLRLKKNKKFYC